FHLARVARDEAGGAQRAAQVLVVFDQRTRDAVADRTGLTGDAAARHMSLDVELVGQLRDLERLTHDHATGLAAEELIDRACVHGDAPGTGLQVNAGGSGLATAGAVILRGGHLAGFLQISSGFGCCAVCGCLPPANTCSFLNMFRPSVFFGSMPLTAISITRSGCSFRSFSSPIDLIPPI